MVLRACVANVRIGLYSSPVYSNTEYRLDNASDPDAPPPGLIICFDFDDWKETRFIDNGRGKDILVTSILTQRRFGRKCPAQ